MGLVFDLAELINILAGAATEEAASSLRSKLNDATLKRSLRKRFQKIVSTDSAEFPSIPAALREVVSRHEFVALICKDRMTAEARSKIEDDIRNATAGMDEGTLSSLATCLRGEALRVIMGSLPVADRLVLNAVLEIREMMRAFVESGERLTSGSAFASLPAPGQLRGAWAGRLMAPPLPGAFCVRPEIHDRIVGLLREPSEVRAAIVAVAGMGGSGKTMLAQAVAHDATVGTMFPDGVLWVEVGDTPEALCQAVILGAAGVGAVGDSVEAGRTALRQRLSGARCLLVLDDVMRASQVEAVDVLGPGSALLVTTRDLDTLPHGTVMCPVGAFDLADPVEQAHALRLLARYAGGPDDIAPAFTGPAEEIVARCGGLPLALAICGGMVSTGYPWETVVDLLRKADLASLKQAFRGYPRPSLLAAIAVGTTTLDARTQALYDDLAVFSTRGGVPVAAAARLWSHHGLDAGDSLRTVILLGRRSLLTYRPADSTFRLHDLQYDYARWRVGAQLPELHGRLADSYLETWGGLSAGLPALDPVDANDDDFQYGMSHMADHLAEAGRDGALHELLAAESSAAVDGSGNRWFDVHDRLGWLAEYLADIDLARARAEKSTDQAGTSGDTARHIATEIRYALMRSSLASIAGSIPPRLLAVLVRRGMWPLEKALAYATVMSDADDRAAALTLLARLLRDGTSERAELLDLAKQAAGGITWSMQRAMAYARIAVAASEPDRSVLFDQALEAAAVSAQQERLRARLLTWLARYYPARAVAELRRGAASGPSDLEYRRAMTASLEMLPELRDDVLDTARNARYRGERGDAYKAVLRCTPEEQRRPVIEEMLAAVAGAGEHWRKEELAVAVVPYLSAQQLPAFLAGILDQASPHTTIEVLAGALPRLPPEHHADALAKAVAAVRAVAPKGDRQDLLALLSAMPQPDRVNLIEGIADASQHADPPGTEWMLCALAPMLPEHLLRRAVDAAGAVSPPSEALSQLAPYLPPDLLRRALAVPPLDSAEEWAQAFVHLAPNLPRASLRQITELVATVKDEVRRLALLNQLAPCLPSDLVGFAAEIAETAESADIETRAQLLAGLAARAEEPERGMLHRQALDMADSEGYPHRRFRPLARMTRNPEQLIDVLRMQCTLDQWRDRHSRAGLGSPALPDAVSSRAVEIVRGIEEPCSRARALAMLVPHVTESRRPGLLKETAEDGFRPHDHPDDIPCEALEALEQAVHAVPAAARLPLTPQLEQDLIRDESRDRMRQLIWLAVYLSDNYGDDLQDQALRCAARLSAADEPDHVRRHGTSAFGKLAPYLSPQRLLQAVALAQDLRTPGERSAALAALAAHADPTTRPAIMSSAVASMRSITSDYQLLEPLARLAPYLPAEEAAALVSRLLDLTQEQQLPHGNSLADTIEAVAPALPAELAVRMADAAHDEPVASKRASSSRALARARSGTSLKHWSPYWRTAITNAAAVGRPTLLYSIAELPLGPSEDQPADETSQIAFHIAQALLDTRRWWPSGP
jgi:hypothetical protein